MAMSLSTTTCNSEAEESAGDEEESNVLPDEDDSLLDETLRYEGFVWNLQD
jgi:hypothetical protein